MRSQLYCMIIFGTLCPILTAFLFDDPCEIVPFGYNENTTIDVFANNSCITGSVSWDFPMGNLRIHFLSNSSKPFYVCFSNSLIGSILTFFDASNGIEYRMEPLGQQDHSETCTLLHKEEVIVRTSPKHLVYVTRVYYRMKWV